jgi:predicted DNA-binding protein (MmcQ/YjbR family)
VNATELRACCLAQVGAIEDFPFGPEHSVFKVAGKMFALSTLDRMPLEVSVKCEPELAVDLRGSYAASVPATTSTSATGTRSRLTAAFQTGSYVT